MTTFDCKKNPEPVNWLERFSGRCYFYPGRDCPGWEYGGKCGRILEPIEKGKDNGADAS